MVGTAGYGYPDRDPAGQELEEDMMSEPTPSQAEGERDDDQNDAPEVPHTTPSQAEGERDEDDMAPGSPGNRKPPR
ncbi:hypothetical protein ACFW6Q_18115 [Streptomyces sp. NPDC058737]|uniref:hypothetical protein n=1 Tax=Streptomyces sp. NPDC058737 TaxID=3346617 RepID=UPI0036B88CC2